MIANTKHPVPMEIAIGHTIKRGSEQCNIVLAIPLAGGGHLYLELSLDMAYTMARDLTQLVFALAD